MVNKTPNPEPAPRPAETFAPPTQAEMRRRRRVCEKMRDEGFTTVAIGKILSVSNGQISRWLRGRGAPSRWHPVPNTEPAAMKEKSPARRPPLLTDEHLQKVYEQQKKWTGPLFSAALREAFGVTYSPKYCAGLLYRFRNHRPTRFLRILTPADKERIAEQRRARNAAVKAARGEAPRRGRPLRAEAAA